MSEIIAESDEVLETHFGLKSPGRKKAMHAKIWPRPLGRSNVLLKIMDIFVETLV